MSTGRNSGPDLDPISEELGEFLYELAYWAAGPRCPAGQDVQGAARKYLGCKHLWIGKKPKEYCAKCGEKRGKP